MVRRGELRTDGQLILGIDLHRALGAIAAETLTYRDGSSGELVAQNWNVQ
jgi:hypothetical protein